MQETVEELVVEGLVGESSVEVEVDEFAGKVVPDSWWVVSS